VVLYGYETFSVTLKEEHRLRVFENRMPRKIFGPKRDEVMGYCGYCRKLHNGELRDLHPSPSIIRIMKSRRMRWAEYVSRMGEKRNAYRLLVGKPEGKRPLGARDICGWIILGCILERWDGLMWTGLVCFRIGIGGEVL
jgi:hypothetical protein